MHEIMLKKSLFSLGIVALGYAVIASIGLAGSVFAETPISKSGERLLAIHDGNTERGILTRATTIRQAFEEAGIPFDTNDIVEPSLDETLVASNYEVNIYRARPVTIVDGSVRKKIMSAYRTPAQIVKHAGMELQSEDITTTSMPDDIASSGAAIQLTIDRATPFTLVLYGKKTQAYTQTKTVAEMLEEKGIVIGEDDTLSVAPNALIVKDMTIELWRNGVQTVTVEEEVPFGVEKIQDVDREVGYREVRTPGVPGKRTVTYEIEMRNGEEVSRKEIQSVVLTEPKKQVEVVGAKIEGPEEIIAKIRAVAGAKGIDVQRVLMIARCESGFNPLADSGYYKGIFQHDPKYWPGRAERYGFAGASYFDVDAQIGVSTSMMAGGGWSHWGCDPGPQQ